LGAALGAAFGAGAVFLSAATLATSAASKKTNKNVFFDTKLMGTKFIGTEFIANSWRENPSSFDFTNGNFKLRGN
jgi:hypothetical protein